MLRTSHFTIYVDLPDDNDHVLLIHGYTGAYDLVLRGIANYMKSLSNNQTRRKSAGSIFPPSENTINILKRRGYLTKMTIDEEQKYFSKLADVLHKKSLSKLPSFIIIPNYDCNLRCPYCYQSHMRENSQYEYLIRRITTEMIDHIFSAMDKLEERHLTDKTNGDRSREIGFYGGEPLLKSNKSIIQYMLRKAHSKNANTAFWAVTNGTNLKEYEDVLGPTHISNLQITFDGPPGKHDKSRIYPNGDGSFEQIASNISFALNKGVTIRIRVNVDRNNISDLPKLAREIVRREWDQHNNFSVYSATIDAINSATDSERVFSLGQLERALLTLREEYPEMQVIDYPDSGLMNQARSIFNNKTFPNFRSNFCKAHTGMYIFDPFGDIYSCWEYTGDKRFRIGYISQDNNLKLSPLLEIWQNRTVAINPQCKQCPYAFYCGGGCAVKATRYAGTYDKGNDLNKNFCDSFASRFRQAVANAFQEYQNGEITKSTQTGLCIS